jgi:hypothetical protein
MTKLPPPLPPSLYDRIAALRDECHALIDKLAAEQAGQGIPQGVIRMQLVAKGGNVFMAAMMHSDPERFAAEQHEARMASLRS